ncbi:MAG: A/G-specific adenine glycosylase [Polyangiales bacterium]
MKAPATAAVRAALVRWYDSAKRDLPWRHTRDPYAIWVAEVMLQQTRVETVLPYYARFLGRFPTVADLAAAPIDDVLASWSGLGYYRRARLLHAGAMHVRDHHAGAVPRDVAAIAEIPGVGRYTTGAIASCAFELEAPLVDGNVARLLSRLFAIELDVTRGEGLARVWSLAESLVVGPRPDALNNALMELGAMICVPREPRCGACPLSDACVARARGIEKTLPIVREKAARPIVREQAIVLRRRDASSEEILVARCVESGLFGGLWEPPRLDREGKRALDARLTHALGVDARVSSKPVRKVRHVLTHRELRIDVHEGDLAATPRPRPRAVERYDAFAWTTIDGLAALGVSTLARKVLGLRR